MGYLTTITVYNDGKDDLKEYAQEFADMVCDKLENHMVSYFPVELPLGTQCNFAKVHRPKHASEKTVYVHCGNTVCEMNANSEETRDLMKRVPKYFDQMLNEMKQQYDLLKAMRDTV